MPTAETAPVKATPAAPATDAAPAAAKPLEIPDTGDVDTIAAALKVQLRGVRDEEPEDEPAAVAADAEAPEDVAEPAAKPAPPPAPDERSSKLARAAELERKGLEKQARLLEREHAQQAREAQLAERETKVQRLEKLHEDPHALLEFITERVPVEKLLSYMEDSQRPEKRAEWAARRVASEATPEVKALRGELTELRNYIQQERMTQARTNGERLAADHARGAATDYPHAAALLAKNEALYLAKVHEAAATIRQSGNRLDFDAITQYINDDLAGYAEIFAPQTGAPPSQSTLVPANQAQVTRARTLSPRTTAGRSSVPSEDETIPSLDERAEQLMKLARRASSV